MRAANPIAPVRSSRIVLGPVNACRIDAPVATRGADLDSCLKYGLGRLEQRQAPGPGARLGTDGQAQALEDLDSELRIFDGSDDLQAATTVWVVFDI